MSSPLDKPTLDTSGGTQSGNRAGISVIGSTTTDERARFQLSREMKILLGVLALGAAVGGWYVFSRAGTPMPGDVTSTVPSQTNTVPSQTNTVPPQTTPPAGQTPSGTTAPVLPGATVTAGTGVTPGAPAGGTAAGSSLSAAVSGGTGPVDVAQVPFLNPQGSSAQGAGTPGDTVPGDTALAGINPADPLAAVPSSNPFQPLTVINTKLPPAAAADAQPSGAGAAPPGSQPGNTVPGTSGVNVAGAVPLPNVPIAGISSGGATLGSGPSLGAGQSSGAGTGGGMPSGGAIPLPVVPIGGLPTASAGNGGVATTAGTSSTGGTAPVVRPMPAAGSITPGLATPTLGGLPLGSMALGNAPAQPGPVTTALQPGVISQYGSANAPVAPVISALDQLVQGRSLVFNAVVLGPINTAIFKTDKGFVVVPTGQTLPDSTVTLKEVTATSATLTLGSDSKILELDKR